MRTALKSIVVAVAIALPVLGAWLASSLAAYANGPRWILLPVALLGFPLLPLGWEALATWRRARRRVAARRILSFGDRLWLRTTALNLGFVALLFGLGPSAAARALSARGDWFLDGVEASWAAPVRAALHTLAAGLDLVQGGSRKNPYDRRTGGAPADDDTPPPMPRGGELQTEPAAETPAPEPVIPIPPPVFPLDAEHVWPRPATLHPVVAAMQPADETSLEKVAQTIVAQEPSALGRMKALHDWVADRIAYDPEALTGVRPPQNAAAVFARRTAVCAGYADLLAALGTLAHVPIAYVIGDARGADGEVDGAGHAWNLATVDGVSYLLDATWDAGYLEGTPLRYVKHYQTDYLFTPPTLFGIDHFPKQAAQQLRSPPISRGDFMRQPQMRPGFFALGLELREPTRSQVTVRNTLDLEVMAPPRTWLLASFEPKGGGSSTRCEVRSDELTRVQCAFPGRGEYRVQLFASTTHYGTYDFVGELLAQDAR